MGILLNVVKGLNLPQSSWLFDLQVQKQIYSQNFNFFCFDLRKISLVKVSIYKRAVANGIKSLYAYIQCMYSTMQT